MRSMPEILAAKRDGTVLTADDFQFICNNINQIPREQLGAFLMACQINGLSPEETSNLTLAMLNAGDKMEEAKEKAGEHMVNYMRWVCHWRGLGNHMDPGEELPETKGKLDLLNYEFLHKRNMLFGTPEYVIDKIHELKSELNLQNLQVWSNFPGVKHKDCMKSIKLFTEKVMPHFQDDFDTEVKKVS